MSNLIRILLMLVFIGGFSAVAQADEEEDLKFSKDLWEALLEQKLVGADSVLSVPYKGSEPHGAFLETLTLPVKVGDYVGAAYVKKNYLGPNISRVTVELDREKYLKAVTVMFQRKAGYDSQNQDWFWAKYKPNGELHLTPQGVPILGKVNSCIQCHSTAPGDDLVFSFTDIFR